MLMNRRRPTAALGRILALSLLVFFIPPVAAQGRAEPPALGAVTGVLPNGLRYYIEPLPSASRIRMMMLVDGGSVDGLPETDAAHVVEHLVVNDAMKQVSAWGGAAGRDVNASTGARWTSYYLDLPANKAPAQELAFSILLQWASPQRFSDDAIDREVKAVIEEARGTSPSAARLFHLRRQVWFGDHPVLSMPESPNGTANATPQAIRAFHARWYRPPQLAIVIAGNVDPGAIEKEIRARFSGLSSGGPANVREPLQFRLSGANRYVPVVAADEAGTSIELTYKRPLPRSYKARLEEAVVARFAEALLDRATARLKDKYSSAVLGGGFSPTFDGYGRHAGVTFTTANFEVRSGVAADGAAQIFGLIEGVRKSGFAKAWIEEVRTRLLTEKQEPDTPERMAARWQSVIIEGEQALKRADLDGLTRTMSADRINRVLSQWFAPKNRDIIVSGSPSASLPGEAEIDRLLASAAAHPAAGFDDAASRAPVLLAKPEETLALADPVEKDGFLLWTLPASGATILYRRIAGADDVRIEALRPGGIRGQLPAHRVLAMAAADVVPASGLGGSDKFELARYLASQDMAIDPFIAETREGFRARGPKRSIETILSIARASLFTPDCRDEALADYRLRQGEANRGGAVGDSLALSALIASRLDMSTPPDDAALARLDLTPVCAAYRSIFQDMRGFTIVVEGDLEPRVLFAGMAANLDIAAAPARPLGPFSSVRESQSGRHTVLAGDGSSATVVLVVQRSSGSDRVDASARIANRLLKDRLTERLRGREKGTYAVSIQAVTQSRPDLTYVAIQFDCDAANVERMIAAAQDELRQLREAGVASEEFAAAKEMVGPDPSPTLYGIAERWIAKADLAPMSPPGRDEVTQWMTRYLEPSLVHVFVRTPVPSSTP